MYIFKEDESIVDIMSVNTMICEKSTISGASVCVCVKMPCANPTQGKQMSISNIFSSRNG
jgi:hypothetical protein